MHLRALDSNQEIVNVQDAEKQNNYRCIECLGVVRVRSGEIRKPHFYHLNATTTCRQNGKSLSHLQLQLYIKEALNHEAFLEVPFSTIHRIADVLWEKEKLVFEIQCSPITRQEMTKRSKDYKSAGYDVIWILHDKRFNQRNLTACEASLIAKPHYYSNMNSEGIGIIYDQKEWIEKGIRKYKMNPLPIDISKPYRHKQHIGFAGDFHTLDKEHPYWIEAQEKEKLLTKRDESWKFHIKYIWNQMMLALLKS